MGMYLNPGNDSFQFSLNSPIYVDKSGLIAYTNTALGTRDRYICVSRPRRFGKSMTADMLVSYYDRTCDSRGQFRGLQIARDPSFAVHLNRYDVIHINMQDVLSSRSGMGDLCTSLEESIEYEVHSAYPHVSYPDRRGLSTYLAAAYAASHVAFVFVIDEWDAVFRRNQSDHAFQVEYLDWLRVLLKDKSYVALAYMTGILPIKKYGQHSALNMFTEISMTDATPISEYTGFTKRETEALCKQWGASTEEIRQWYDGYDVDGVQTYSPRSVVQSLTRGNIANYWTQTESFEALRVYIEMDMDGLRERVIELVSGGEVDVDTSTFQNDMTTFATADDVLTLLVHLGYLTVDSKTKRVRIPNQEVAEQFASTLRSSGWREVVRSLQESDKLMRATLASDQKTVARLVQRSHEDACSILRYNDENSLACTLSLAYYSARRTYVIHREQPAGKGFADLVFVPRREANVPALIMELKVDDSPENAIKQIKERGYLHGLVGHAREALLIGIAYHRNTKEHRCIIEASKVA